MESGDATLGSEGGGKRDVVGDWGDVSNVEIQNLENVGEVMGLESEPKANVVYP
mgnify:CR=1 FL=1